MTVDKYGERREKPAVKKNLNLKVKHVGRGVMIWGSMAFSEIGNFEIIHGIMTKEVCLGILQKNLHNLAGKLGRRYTFQEDKVQKTQGSLRIIIRKLNKLD